MSHRRKIKEKGEWDDLPPDLQRYYREREKILTKLDRDKNNMNLVTALDRIENYIADAERARIENKDEEKEDGDKVDIETIEVEL